MAIIARQASREKTDEPIPEPRRTEKGEEVRDREKGGRDKRGRKKRESDSG